MKERELVAVTHPLRLPTMRHGARCLTTTGKAPPRQATGRRTLLRETSHRVRLSTSRAAKTQPGPRALPKSMPALLLLEPAQLPKKLYCARAPQATARAKSYSFNQLLLLARHSEMILK